MYVYTFTYVCVLFANTHVFVSSVILFVYLLWSVFIFINNLNLSLFIECCLFGNLFVYLLMCLEITEEDDETVAMIKELLDSRIR